MMNKKRLAMAVALSAISAQAYALELGEFGGANLSIGGYVKAEGIFTDPDGGDRNFDASARQSRINFKVDKDVQGHSVTGFIEGDFWDNATDTSDTSYAMRLRHAYIQVDDFTLGQTWTGQFFANAPFDVEILDFYGTGVGTVSGSGAVVRPDLVLHYTPGGFRFSLQDPVYQDADFPDMVASYTHRTEAGHAFNAAVTGREVETGIDDSEFGAAFSLAAKLNFGATSLALSGYTGKGNNVYSGWGYNGATSPISMAASGEVNADGDLVSTTGYSAGVSHRFNEQFRGNIRYAQVEADEVAPTVADDTLEMINVNLIYTYLPNLDFGIEWRDRNATTMPLRPGGQQVELMAMYKF
ncbi:hypothetical protein HOP62_20220 [Halomonas sp. MCCC 1A17488]|uniref:Porin n=1 Tax=Billgrantia sulfidoxydans TaxID=2733484 RepID=A0ABX7W8C4_9GAMM|nr:MULTISPECIES: hypothetical protein [Halomonas]MCE8018411.1 hypothetical protein [Halomonas sp. MCCC 1A17488]MCG3241744.1 hypothetical protein [Halomonas sp. MCCC 1A17488]QPP49229.1 hypothetical protein I4484_18930 [Halomonas sp. SS10-MC5]QTP56584.1 hypothetical protein HNO51_18985 [Halomonas sulfidoxydans]